MQRRMDPADDIQFPLGGLLIWVREPFVLCFRSWNDQFTTLDMSIEGVKLIEQNQAVVSHWFNVLPPDLPEYARTMLEQGRHDTIMQAVTRSEQVLLSEAIIMLWGGLETAIEDFLIVWYQHNPSTLMDDRARKIKVPLTDFEAMDADGRGMYVINQLKQMLSADEKASINRFESLLTAFGLSGEIDSEIKRTLRELGHIRNVLVHRGGYADRRLVDACQWLGLTDGDVVVLSREQYIGYLQAAFQYITMVLQRLYPRFGWEKYTNEAGESGWCQSSASSASSDHV